MLVPGWGRELSLDRWLDDDETCTLTTFLAEPRSREAEERILRNEVASVVRAAVSRLADRESHIIRNRFGLLGGQELTLEQIGRDLNLSRERVRQIERRVKNRLRVQLTRQLSGIRASKVGFRGARAPVAGSLAG